MSPNEQSLQVSDSNDAKLEAICKRIDQRFDELCLKLDEVERRAELRHQEVMFALRQLLDAASGGSLDAKQLEKIFIQ